MNGSWSYWIPELGPLQWKKSYEDAGGSHQSPISLNDVDVRADLGLLRADDFHFGYESRDCVSMANTGFTWKLAARPENRSALRAGHLGDGGSYRLDHVHAHWGTTASNGSEHLVNGIGFAAEVHIVHYNSKYGRIEEAFKHPDGLAVLGIFLKETKIDNPVLEPIVKCLPRIKYKGQSVPLEQGFDVAKLIPANKDFWTYNGSLTTPPCCECVSWTLFRCPLTISERQLDHFRSLSTVTEPEAKSKSTAAMINNVRPVQQLHKRILRASFTNTINSHAYHFHNSSIF